MQKDERIGRSKPYEKPIIKRQCKVCDKWFEADEGFALLAYRLTEVKPDKSIYICDRCFDKFEEKKT